jgi:bifunctional non-homologous end joining protein LigD
VAAFQLLRHRRNEPRAFLYAFDVLELNGKDLRGEPIEVRKATLASILRKGRPGVRLKEHLEHPDGALVFARACKMGLEGIVSKRLVHRVSSIAIAVVVPLHVTTTWQARGAPLELGAPGDLTA